MIAQFRFTIAAILLLASAPVVGQTTVVRGASLNEPISIQLDGIATGSLVVMLMRDVMQVPYVIAPDVLQDRRPTSVRLSIPRDQVPQRVVSYLRQAGYAVTLQGGTVYVSRAGGEAPTFDPAIPSGSPLSPGPVGEAPLGGAPVEPEPGQLAAYIPAHRDPGYLGSILTPLFPDVTFGADENMRADGEQQVITGQLGPDVLIYSGSADDLARVGRAIEVLDRPRALVAVKAVVMQVSDAETRGSALSVLAAVAGDRLSAGSFADLAPGSQFVRLSTGALSAVLSAVREDTRFKVIASPNLAALSGSVATINAGAQVPTLGAVSVAEGVTVQSVVYRDSGITLQVRPIVRGGMIELEVRQERSNFIPTTTGVDDSPTLQTSSVSAQALLRPGESIALAGLTEQSDSNRKEGLFGGLLGVRSRDKSESELLVMLQADLVPVGEVAAGTFLDLSPVEPEPEAVDNG